MTRRARVDVAAELGIIANLGRAECTACWRKEFGIDPPRYLSAVFMRKALAFELQFRAQGELPSKIKGH